MQIQVRVKRVLEKVPEKVPGSLGAHAKSSSADSGDGCRSQAGSGSLNSRTLSRGVSRAGFRSTLQTDL